MNLTDLKTKPIEELLQIAENIGLENMARNRKQDVIFTILKRHAKSGEEIHSTATAGKKRTGTAGPPHGSKGILR